MRALELALAPWRSPAVAVAALTGIFCGIGGGALAHRVASGGGGGPPVAELAADAGTPVSPASSGRRPSARAAGNDRLPVEDLARTPPSPAEPQPEPEPEPEPELAILRFEVDPPSATVTVDGERVRGHRRDILLAKPVIDVEIVAEAEGYRRYEERVAVTKSATLTIRLTPDEREIRRRRGKRDARSGDSPPEEAAPPETPSLPAGPGGLIDL